MSKQIEAMRSGLVAMKTLLSRDPCIHADVAIGMIDAMLAEQPAQPLTDEQIDAEFDAFASKFDHESNEWLDMGVYAYFRAGFKAATGITKGTP